ncbi:MAG: hypothetical protein KF708_21915 [Pirellulales bacterium]|nr:hypothetical protein [Pirellulales bacterium]
MRYDESSRGEPQQPAAALNDDLRDSPELLALAEQLRDDARHLSAAFPARRDVPREFAYARSRAPRRWPLALAASLAAVGLTVWGVAVWKSSSVGHGPAADARPAVAVAGMVAPPATTSGSAVAPEVMLVPVASYEEVEELTIPEREAVFDLLEGESSEVAYLSI